MSIKVYVDEKDQTVRVDFGEGVYAQIRPSAITYGEILYSQNPSEILAASADGSKLVYESKPETTPEPEGDFAYTHGTVNQPLIKAPNGYWRSALSTHGVSWDEIVRMYPNAKEAK